MVDLRPPNAEDFITEKQHRYIEVLMEKCKNSSHYAQYTKRYREAVSRQEASSLIEDMKEELDAI